MNTKTFTIYAGLLILAASIILLNGCGANITGVGTPTNTITSITGRLDGVTEAKGAVHANALGHLNITMPTSYDAITHTFEVRNVPVNDTIYIKATQNDASSTWASTSFSYGRVDVTTEPSYLVITFEAQATVDATCTLPSGYSMYGYGAYISRDDKHLLQIYSTGGGSPGTSFAINRLPRILLGDSYIITLVAKNTYSDSFQKEFFDIQAGSSPFDMTTPAVPTTPFLIFPPNGATFETGTPTFEWQPISWADHYVVHVYTSDMLQGVWTLVTTETIAVMPSSVMSAAGSGNFNWEVEVWPITAYTGCYFQNGTLPKYTIP